MSKVVIFWTYIPKFLLVSPKIFSPSSFFKHPQIFLRLYKPKNCFLALKIQFLRPKKIFQNFLDLKTHF